MSFADKVVLVTGASSGIGAATALAFVKEGADVVIVGRNEDKLKNVAEQCENNGKKPLVIKADITYEEQVEAMVKEAIEIYGKIDVLVNNAGLIRFGSLTDGNMLKAYDEVMLTNVRAQVHVTSVAVEHLIKSKGNIVNISSVAGLTVSSNGLQSSYFISKAALNQFTKCSAAELAQHGVRVNAVCPGPAKSDIMVNAGSAFQLDSVPTPLGKILEAEEVADVILFLAGDKAKGITGSTYVTDCGFLLTN